MNAQALSI